jgi:hypothetical protein
MDEKRIGGVDDGIRAEFSLLLLPASFLAVVLGVDTIAVTLAVVVRWKSSSSVEAYFFWR